MNETIFSDFLIETQKIVVHNDLKTIEDKYMDLGKYYDRENWEIATSHWPYYSADHKLHSGTGHYQDEAVIFFIDISREIVNFIDCQEITAYSFIPGFEDCSYYKPVTVVGVKNSANEGSIDFINLMLSEEVEKGRNDAIPVNKNAIEKQLP